MQCGQLNDALEDYVHSRAGLHTLKATASAVCHIGVSAEHEKEG